MLNVDIEGKNEKLPVTQMGCLKCKLTFVSWSQKKIDPSWSCKFKNDLKKIFLTMTDLGIPNIETCE